MGVFINTSKLCKEELIVKYEKYITILKFYEENKDKVPKTDLLGRIRKKFNHDYTGTKHLLKVGLEKYEKELIRLKNEKEYIPLRFKRHGHFVDIYRGDEILRERLTPLEARNFADKENNYVPKVKGWDEDTLNNAKRFFGERVLNE